MSTAGDQVEILRADWVVPVSSPAIRDGCVVIRGGRIEEVRPAAEILREHSRRSPTHAAGHAGAAVVDLGPAILTPGLVNPHTHLELTCYNRRLPPAPFWAWLEGLIQLRRAAGQVERETAAVTDGAWQSLRSGVTCVGDISRMNLHWRALKDLPMRKVCFVEILTLADAPPRTPDELRSAATDVVEDELLRVGISPHAPYSVPPEFVRAAIETADSLGRPWCMHWSETLEERKFLAGDCDALPPLAASLCRKLGIQPPGLAPGELLTGLTRGLRPGALAHANYVTDAEMDELARSGQCVIYCPRAHAFFGHPPHPIGRLRKAGVTVAIATDSAASNDDLSMLDELRFLHRIRPEFSAADLLRMATLDAARALGLENGIGSIDAGKQADLAAFRVEGGSAMYDPHDLLFRADTRAAAVWVAGKQVALESTAGRAR